MESQRVLSDLAGIIDGALPGSRRRAPIVSATGGFIFCGSSGGQIAVYGGFPGQDPWVLTITAGIARDIENVSGAIAWCNSHNTSFTFGRFYATIPSSGSPRAHVVWQENMHSTVLDIAPNLHSSNLQSGWLPQLLRLGEQVAENESVDCIASIGGVAFADSDEDRLVLMAASHG